MKRCPGCGREYDNTMMFCLDDGAELLYGPASGSEPGAVATGFPSDEPQTAILHSTAAPGEAPTRAQIHTTEKTAVLPNGTAEAPKPKGFDKRFIAAPVLAVLIAAALYVGYRYLGPFGSADQIESIAVLPFVNASGDKETEFLSDGLAETLINSFTKIPGLKVAARSSAFRFRGREGEPKEIGRDLGVGSMLTGKFLQRGDSVSIQVDLVNTSDGLQIWGNRYEGKASDIVSIQQRIATEVSQQLKLKLTGAQAQEVAKTYTQNAEAYQHYLRGRFYWNKRTSENLRFAIEEFRLAVEKDPNYALAYAGLADSYVLLGDYAEIPGSEPLLQAKAFADKALALDPDLAEPYATLGSINRSLRKWEESEVAFKRAIELNPNYPTAYHWYSIFLRNTGRMEEAHEMIKKAALLDPLSLVIISNLSINLLNVGDVEGALAECRKMQSLDPSFIYVHECFGSAYLALERFDEAITEFRKYEIADKRSDGISELAVALARGGGRDEARDLLRRLEDMYSQGRKNAINVAEVYLALEDHDKVFLWLEKAFDNRDNDLPGLLNDRRASVLKGDPRYESLLKRTGLK